MPSAARQVSRRDHSSWIICDDCHRARRIRARVESVIAGLKARQILRRCCRRRGHAINDSHETIAGLWKIKTLKAITGHLLGSRR